jgi:transposase
MVGCGGAVGPLYRVRNILHRAAGDLTERQWGRLTDCLGRTLRQWKDTYLGHFTTGGANNGGTEAVNGIIELHRRIARGYHNPDNYRLRMLLVAGGLLLPPELR